MEPEMVQVLSFAASLAAFVPSAAAAPPGSGASGGATVAVASASATPAAMPAGQTSKQGAVASLDATAAAHCARSGELLGSNCSYTTGMMARRVLEEGQEWGWEGALTPSPNNLESMVAAPFTVTPGTHVIANELLEMLTTDGYVNARLALAGKLLEIDGVRYVVLTSFRVINT